MRNKLESHAGSLLISPEVIAKCEKSVEKVWGKETWLVNNAQYCCKLLHLKKGFASSTHFHKSKSESFIVLSGLCVVETFSKPRSGRRPVTVKISGLMAPGDRIELPARLPHRFFVPKSAQSRGCLILEVSSHHDDRDVVRIEPSRKL